ncbi:MAG: pseudouridine synthase [Bacteroidota bacterium]
MQKRGSERFSKFNDRKGAAKKEQIRQDKREVRKEREAFFEAKRRGPQQASPRNQQLMTRPEPAKMPLNKYLAHAGVAARREAADMIRSGLVNINGKPVTEPGYKVLPGDIVKFKGKPIKPTSDFVYILLNKPKDYITTMRDPQKRKTVMDIVRSATRERIFPVGRLDRNTTGVLLLTNDGELAQSLSHPSNEIKKVYHVQLNRPLDKKDFEALLKGVELEDGLATVDVLAYADLKDKTQIGVEIHSGKKRIVRRLFEHFGYDVKGLDRVIFAGLTKKNVDRGKWRLLTEKEIRDLKYFGKGK